MKLIPRQYFVELLNGLSRAATVMLMASGVWLVASAATTSNTPKGLNILVLVSGITCALFFFAGRRLGRNQVILQTSWASTLIPGLAGSGIAFFIEWLAGITTLVLVIIALLIRVRLSPPLLKDGELAASEEQLSVRIRSALSGNFEAKIFNYDDRIHEELRSDESDLSTKEVEALHLSGFLPASVYFIMGLSVVSNIIIGLNSMAQGRLDILDLAILALLPLTIFEEVESHHGIRKVRRY